jgi:hypothetical protein
MRFFYYFFDKITLFLTPSFQDASPTTQSSILISPGLGETTEIQFPSLTPQNEDGNTSIQLQVDFESIIRSGESKDTLHGLYTMNHPSSPYHKLSTGLCTQFEPCYARRAFPCFDEPSLRCRWSLDLVLPAGCDSRALFNTDPTSVHTDDASWPVELLHLYQEGRRLFRFPHTSPISSYLVAICVGSFDSVSKSVNMKINQQQAGKALEIRCFGPAGRGAELEYALDLAGRAVIYFCDQLKIDLPMQKMDLVGVPLGGLGMENHSLLTFQWEHFLVNAETPFARRQRIARLIFHEVAHQWFGNLVRCAITTRIRRVLIVFCLHQVTIEWWSYLYLKEGLARFLEYHLIEAFFPEWNYWQHFQDEIYAAAMEKDEDLKRTHSIEVPLGEDARSYSGVFDVISYGKAACVLRSVCNFAGIGLWPAFKRFVHENKFGAVSTPDLWRSIAEETGQPQLVSWLDCWIKRAGHPVLSLSLGSDGKILYQQLPTQSIKEKPFEPFPIFSVARVYNMTTKESKMHHFVLDQIAGEIPNFSLANDEVLVFNSGHVGFFRTALDENMMKRFLQLANNAPDWYQDEVDNLLFDVRPRSDPAVHFQCSHSLYQYTPLLIDNPTLFKFDHVVRLTQIASFERPHCRKLAFLRDNLARLLVGGLKDESTLAAAKNFAVNKIEKVLSLDSVRKLLPSPLSTMNLNDIALVELFKLYIDLSDAPDANITSVACQFVLDEVSSPPPTFGMTLGLLYCALEKKNLVPPLDGEGASLIVSLARENLNSKLKSVRRQARLVVLGLSTDQVELQSTIGDLGTQALLKLAVGLVQRPVDDFSSKLLPLAENFSSTLTHM